MNRRIFFSTFGLSVLAAPLAVEAQQKGKVWRVGILVTANRRDVTS